MEQLWNGFYHIHAFIHFSIISHSAYAKFYELCAPMVLKNFLAQVAKYQWRHCKVLIAVSGGVDSMVLAALFAEAKAYFQKRPEGLAGFDIAVAHCNFQLRGQASDADAEQVKSWCEKNEIPFHQKRFETQKQIEAEGGSIQIVARKQRYDWFEELRKELKFDCIATAHHKEDSVETLLMNFFSGTGIAGLHGILPEKKRIIRPILPFTKAEIIQYAGATKTPWREDASNQKLDYLRNKIRLELIPQIEAVFPQAQDALYENAIRFGEVEQLYSQGIASYRKKLLEKRGNDFYIPLRKLIHCQPLATILYELLQPFGLRSSQLQEALQLIHSDSGKYITFGENRLLRDRNFLIITALETKKSDHILVEKIGDKVCFGKQELRSKMVNKLPSPSQIGLQEAFLDFNKLTFPLTLRPWREGDYFYPFGMGGKKKKVKKVLIDLKMPLHEKENVWVLENQKKIVWICGIRIDVRFALSNKTKEVVHLQLKTTQE